MKQLNSVSIKRIVGLLLVPVASVGYSSIVFEAGFRGPGNGAGGPYDLVNLGGTGQFNEDSNGQTILGVFNNDPMGDGDSYVSCAITNYHINNASASMITMTPESAATSLDAMTDVVGGHRIIKGGFDFFLRTDKEILNSEARTIDADNRGNSGIRLIFTTQSPGIRTEIISPTDGLLSGGEGGTPTNFRYTSGTVNFKSNTVYHLGMTFETDSGSNITANIWAQEGDGAIDLTTASPAGSITFGIDENIVTSGFSQTSYNFGQLRFNSISYDSMTQDYDQFRIYDETPTSFGALEKTADPTWRESNPETVLQADFNGAGSGTGGKDNIVTFGGTAVLTDNGSASVASILTENPLRVSGTSSSRGYMSILSTTNNPGGIFARTSITPASTNNSLASMTVNTNGHVILQGGLDFFFRNNHDISETAEFRPFDSSNDSNDGLRFVLYNYSDKQFKIEIITDDNSGLYSGGEGGSLVKSLIYTFPAHINSNTVYHVGLSFDGSDTGNITATVWLKEGHGAIDLHEDLPIGSLTFAINESVVTAGLTAEAFGLGKLRNNGDYPSTQEFDCLRVYNDTPITFGELPAPSTGTVVIIQ